MSESGAGGSGRPGALSEDPQDHAVLSRSGAQFLPLAVVSGKTPVQIQMLPTALDMLTAGPGEVPWPSPPVPTCSLAPDSQSSLWAGPRSQPWRDGRGGTVCYFCSQRCFNLGINQLAILPEFNF